MRLSASGSGTKSVFSLYQGTSKLEYHLRSLLSVFAGIRWKTAAQTLKLMRGGDGPGRCVLMSCVTPWPERSASLRAGPEEM